MDEDLKQHITAKETWLRGLFILLFAFLLMVARLVTWAVVVLQFLFTLVTGRPNANLLTLGGSLAQFIYQCFSYVTYNSDDRPFPFSDWPAPPQTESTPATTKSSVQESETAANVSKKKKAPAKKTARKKATTKKAAEKQSATELVSSEATPVEKSSDDKSEEEGTGTENPRATKPEE